MIQPASSLLFNRSGPASRFREQLFSKFKVEEVVNLSALRFELFDAASPACIVTLHPSEPDSEPLSYICPKQIRPVGGAEVTDSQYTIVIEPHDISRIWPEEAALQPHAWTALAWGGRRDLTLIKRLSVEENLQKLFRKKLVRSREGIIRGAIEHREILQRHILKADDFPDGTVLTLSVEGLPVNTNPKVHRRTDLEAFNLPQLLIKQGWTKLSGRFRAVLCDGAAGKGAICSQSYISVHTKSRAVLESAALSYNSIFAVYFLLLTSGRLASYRPEPLVEEMRGVPFAPPQDDMLAGLRTLEDVDDRVRKAFGFKDAEWTLVDDLFRYTLPDFKGDETSPGRQLTERSPRFAQPTKAEPQLAAYCRYFVRVLKAGFGQDKQVCATIFQDDARSPLPVRLVAIHLDWPRDEKIVVEPIDSPALCEQLMELDQKWLTAGQANRGGIFYQRVAMVYSEFQDQRRSIPTVYIVKPDRIRYWTRSAALRDADEVAADVQLRRQRARPASRGRK
jgi:hypothetical protein